MTRLSKHPNCANAQRVLKEHGFDCQFYHDRRKNGIRHKTKRFYDANSGLLEAVQQVVPDAYAVYRRYSDFETRKVVTDESLYQIAVFTSIE